MYTCVCDVFRKGDVVVAGTNGGTAVGFVNVLLCLHCSSWIHTRKSGQQPKGSFEFLVVRFINVSCTSISNVVVIHVCKGTFKIDTSSC